MLWVKGLDSQPQLAAGGGAEVPTDEQSAAIKQVIVSAHLNIAQAQLKARGGRRFCLGKQCHPSARTPLVVFSTPEGAALPRPCTAGEVGARRGELQRRAADRQLQCQGARRVCGRELARRARRGAFVR